LQVLTITFADDDDNYKKLTDAITACEWCSDYSWFILQLVVWHRGRTSVFGWWTFLVLLLTCSWWLITYVG